MFGLGFSEVLLILVLALLILGPKKLPQAAKELGRASAQLKRAMNELRRDINIDDINIDSKLHISDLNILPEEQRSSCQDSNLKAVPFEPNKKDSGDKNNVDKGSVDKDGEDNDDDKQSQE